MSLKKVEQAKADRGFKKLDILVYALIAVIISSIFLSLFLTRDTDPLKGVEVYVKREAVFRCTFDNGKCEYDVLSDGVTVEESGILLLVRVETDGEFNLIRIDPISPSVSIIEADCRGQDCTTLPPITDNNSMLYCSPHGLVVQPYNYLPDDDGYIIF